MRSNTVILACLIIFAGLSLAKSDTIRCMTCGYNDTNCFGTVVKDCVQCQKIQYMAIPTTSTAPPFSTLPGALVMRAAPTVAPIRLTQKVEETIFNSIPEIPET